ncbi:MAG: DUF4397 domain-containing protein [Wenzhouxiangella sp.]|jgi:hypothetical protein|nr:DUF4397 domain-containing protein [Wenzhouxiangella sp.]
MTSRTPFSSLIAVAALLVLSTDALAQARVQIVHAAPFASDAEATSVTVSANGSPVIEDFRFADFTDYLELPAGSYDLAVTPTGATEAAIEATVMLEDGVDYTVVAVGDGVNQDLALLPLVDDATAPGDGNLNIRVVHAAPFAAELAATEVSIRTAGGDLVNGLTGVPYLAESGFFAIPAGEYDLKVASNDGSTNLIDPLPVDLPAGINVTVIAIGDGSNQPLGILALPVGVIETRTPVDFTVAGWWESLNTENEGYIVQPIPAQNRIVGTIYTYDPAGSGTPIWFTFDGPFDGRTAVAEVFSFTGAQFAGDTPANGELVGTVALEFIDCNSAIAAISLADSTEFTWDLGRLTQAVTCSLE